MMGIDSCRWVRARLPLFAADDLVGEERRRVQRHLVNCRACGRHLAEFEVTQGVLQQFAVQTTAADQAPASLWPDLARQIRESRRPCAVPASWFALMTRPLVAWSAAGLAILLMGAAIGLLVYQTHQTGARQAAIASAQGRGGRPAFEVVRTIGPRRSSATSNRPSSLAQYEPRRDPVLQRGARAAAEAPPSSAIGLSQ